MLLGFGDGEKFDLDAASSILDELVADVAANCFNRPRLVWYTADARHDQRYPWQTISRVVAYNSAMVERLQAQRPPFPPPYDVPVPILDLYNMIPLGKCTTNFARHIL